MDQNKIREARTRWFQDARFGLFIHRGLYAIPARGEPDDRDTVAELELIPKKAGGNT